MVLPGQSNGEVDLDGGQTFREKNIMKQGKLGANTTTINYKENSPISFFFFKLAASLFNYGGNQSLRVVDSCI